MRTTYTLPLRSLTLTLLLILSHALKAQVWDGTSVSSSLNGDGTAEHPYEVKNGADLKLVQSDQKYWKNGVHILQIDDIDLGGHELGLIGYGNGEATGNDIHSSSYKPFFGIYDGGGHVLNNLLVYWDVQDKYHHSAGLFGLLAGAVRNLHIDNAHITRTATATKQHLKCDMRIGVVAGAVAPNKNGDKQVRVENIIISNARIDDGGINTDMKTYFIGGVVGDVSCGYGGTANISASNYGYVHIRNIYANVDIDLSTSVRTTSDVGSITQFDIGGIVGRMRRGKQVDLPVDVVFRGKIKAPRAAIAPYICMSRCNGTNNVNGMNDTYTGEVLSSANTTSNTAFVKLSSDQVKIEKEWFYPNENRFFSGYEIWDPQIGDSGGYVEITNSYPTVDENRGLRTLAHDGSTLTTNAPPEMMRSWQGVNHGSYINLSTNIGATTATNRLNSLNDPVKFAWDADAQTFRFSANEYATLSRKSLHAVTATIYNDNRTSNYIYSWTLTDREGNTKTFETEKNPATPYSNPEVNLDVDLNSCTLTMKEDFRQYTKATITLYDQMGHSLTSAELDLPDFSVSFTRSVDTEAERYTFSPVFSFDGEDLDSADPLLSNLEYRWDAYKWKSEEWILDNSSIVGEKDEQAVTVKKSFVGSVRLVVSDVEIPGKVYYLTGDGTPENNYMEQVLEKLRFTFTMQELIYDSDTDTETYKEFNPADYFTGSSGYAISYAYDNTKTSGTVIIDEAKTPHYLSDSNTRGTLKDTRQRPLVFVGTVVDQFGNVVPYDKTKYRIQWNFKIPDSRDKLKRTHPKAWNNDFDAETKKCTVAESWDYDSDSGFTAVNGRYPAISGNVSGNGIDWVADYFRDLNNQTSQWACDRWGEYAVVESTTFKIHPNLLHCTSGFDVRAVLYDVTDPLNPTSIETTISFSQVDINTEKVPEGYKATVSWRANDQAYTSGSTYSFKWYSNPDPTDYDGWTEVEGAGVDYLGGFPADYDGDRRRFSILQNPDPTLFYKVEFRTSSGTYAEGITGPENVIFVYDRAATLENPNFHDFDVFDVQSNYYYPQGDDTNHGRDPWHAVATMAQAFKLLDSSGTYKTNRIVVMGFYHEYNGTSDKDYFLHSSWWNKVTPSPTTISGAYGAYIKGGTLGLGFESTSKPFDLYLKKPMRWENMTLFTLNTNNTNQNCLYASSHDFIMGKGVKLINFNALAKESGILESVKVPNFTIVAGHYDYMQSTKPWSDPIYEMNNSYKIDYEGNEIEGLTTLKILSGGAGRIIGASRNSGSGKTPALYGTPDNPNRVRIEIDIPHEEGKEKEYLPVWKLYKAPNDQDITVNFTHDLGIVVGGQTDGSTFSDTEITIRNAHVARYVSGNITFGRPMSAYDASYNFPEDGYFGRTVLNIYGGTFDEMYGGSLGRTGYTYNGADNMVKAFFYGESIINMYGGVIGDEKKPTEAKLFAAGAGGVIGKGEMWHVVGSPANDERKTYTVDDCIPFLKADGTLEFRAFDESRPDARMPIMNCMNSDGTPHPVDLTDSKVEINLYGGVIYGNVYGGGFGYASNMKSTRSPFRVLESTHELQGLAGNLYGKSYVRLLPNPDRESPDVVIHGNVYGAGAGDEQYISEAAGSTRTIGTETYTYNFTEIAKTFGESNVIMEAGHVLGDVFGGGCGINKYAEMANIYGNTNLEIRGGIVEGNIYGGAAFSDIRKYTYTAVSGNEETAGGDTHTKITGGTIGNCVFGGGRGEYDAENDDLTAASNVSGDTYMEISGGSFSEEPYLFGSKGQESKHFNIYGGAYINGSVRGDTHVNIKSSLLQSSESIDREFTEAWNDMLDRRFCIYGAGYGELTHVEGNTYVDIDIEETGTSVSPDIRDIDRLIPGQTLFDVAGGGYSGNTGYWIDTDGNPITSGSHTAPENYDHYVGGELHVTVQGYPFIRKVIGGSFYAECNNTNTYLKSGSIKEVYGGALMGYVHDHASLNIGSKAIDGKNSSGFNAKVLMTVAEAAENNSRLFITGNVYGGNDVKGIVGTTFWVNDVPGDNFGKYGTESTDGAPLFCSDVSEALNKGISLAIHGGTIAGNVYGAGNGHYRGYYVPDWVRYDDGPARHYRKVRLTGPEGSEVKYGKVYRCRPMTGSVTMHIGGNSTEDRVTILGNLYGGGRSCTIGQWNTILPYEDPRRLVKAGFLHMNFGSHVNVTSVYIGAQGDDFMRPKELLKANLAIGDGEVPTSLDLDEIGDIAYDHWYLTSDGTRYMPGFPPPGEVDGNYGMLGAHMLRGYAKNIEMNADIELTFYRNPFKLEADGTPVMSADGTTVVCKKWLPAERAHTDYDATDVTFTNFFGGGASGFMTNNKLMRYDYTTGAPLPDITYNYYKNGTSYGVNYEYNRPAGHDIENYGTIYRYSLPPGLTVLDKVVGGSEDAIDSTRGYTVNGDETITFDDNTYYTFEGGLVTQCSYTYDLIVHNDKYYNGYNKNLDHAIPAEHFAHHSYPDQYEILNGPDAGMTIYRWHIPENEINPNSAEITDSRYDLAYYYDLENDPGKTKKLAYCGPRESRIEGNETVLKLTVGCQFDPQEGDSSLTPTEGEGSAGGHENHYGGVIYGGCYNSGVTQGDIILSVSSNTLGGHQDVSNPEAFGSISSLAHNVGRVFGGGYGPNSRVDGDTHVNLILNFVGMNVFGGGCRGNVNGTAHVKYLADENKSFVLGSIYGGSLYGSVGVEGVTPVATDVRLYSGNADKVYGGSCLGDLYGRTNVELCDEVTTGLEYFDLDRLLDNKDIDYWGGSRLIVGSVFGGNDVAGHITPQPITTVPGEEGYDEKDLYATYIRTYETPHVDTPSSGEGSGSTGTEIGPGKQTPGAVGAYNGYPLIGYLYAGSNGNYGNHDIVDTKDIYILDEEGNAPSITFATGERNAVMQLQLSGKEPEGDGDTSWYAPFEIPNVKSARLDLQGGTIVNAYGGGDCATITEKSLINVDYQHDTDIMDARAGFISEDDFVRTWNTCHLSHTDQMDEVTYMRDNGTGDGNTDRVFRFHIYRLFGGNDKAQMDIQPTWKLVSGHLRSVYSGGNFGTMTYFSRDNEGKPVGLALNVDSPHFHADAVYGGGRVGDIRPNTDDAFRANEPAPGTLPEPENEVYDFYGATLNINQGVIDHVYGGNDVSGNVSYGTKVLLHGAISGDVYCAGNGDYLYKYDEKYEGTEIQELFDSELGRYFLLPQCAEYGGDSPSNVERVLAINHYRPNVDRSYLHIEGSRDPDTTDAGGNPVKGEIHYAYVRGNVYCGGNSSTVGSGADDGTEMSGITFNIGNYAMLNGVFLGSNGENLVDPTMMRAFEDINGLNLADPCPVLTEAAITGTYDREPNVHDREVILNTNKIFPNLLDVYMRAVDVYSVPSDLRMLSDNIEESYIGDFYVGGNRGSMLTDKTISLTFPHDLVIFGKIVGGSNNANVTYKNIDHKGGLTRPLAKAASASPGDGDDTEEDEKDPDKVYLQVLSRFEPWKMTYPAKNQFGETDYRVIKVVPDVDKIGDDYYFPESKCSIFGGCFTSGHTQGNIHVDLYSDLSGEYSPESEIYKQIESLYHIGTGVKDVTKERIIVNGIDKLQRRSFALIGGGYGRETSVMGNIRLHLLPGKFHPSFTADNNESPSAATIFAGSEKGEVVGNTEITVRDGVVLSNLYGGSESSTLYGSTNIIIGWPQYYICNRTGEYKLNRTDTQSLAARGLVANAPESNEPDPVKKVIRLCKGDYVSVNLFRQMDHSQTGLNYILPDAADPLGNFEDAEGKKTFTYVYDDTPEKYAEHNNSPYVKFHDITWDDINIYIGNNESRLSDRAEYYAHGNIYGGGFITANSGTTLAGEYTVCKFDERHTPDEALIGYGGNSTIMIWDNPDNADINNPVGGRVRKHTAEGLEETGTGAIVRDHITIGTGHYKKVTLKEGQDAMGYYVFREDPNGKYELNGQRGVYVHQSSHIIGKDETTEYFEIESDGGIYGGGRKVYVQGFRNCDLAYYGYADYTPQYPKLLNTAQRLDLFTLTDCCLMMQGAVDFASNNIDATRYSMTRVKELEMRSSIRSTEALSPGERDNTALANVLHSQPRMRNYLAFFHDVLYVSAMTSSEAFSNPYRGANGQLGYIGNFTKTGIDNTDHTVPAGSDYEPLVYDAENPFTYKQYKTNRIGNYYANRNQPAKITVDEGAEEVDNPIKLLTSLEFDQRNVGTAANMIGINNGYTLKVQGAVVNSAGRDEIYYGPVNGVFEVKLMTLATDEGGGYIYALNQHDDPNHFLETTGNFVFPGAAYKLSSQNAENAEDYNYVYDDCYPMGKGWDGYWNWNSTDPDETTTSMGPTLHVEDVTPASIDDDHIVCDNPDQGTEVHYWYVNGSNFYFNVTLTAYTYKDPQFFHLNNNEDLIYLYGIGETSDITLESATWTPKELLNVDGYESDLQNISEHPGDYQIFLSIDDDPGTDHTVGTGEHGLGTRPDAEQNHAYVTRIPRADLTTDASGSTTADALYDVAETVNKYGDYTNAKGETVSNSPLLGITLYDKCDNAHKGYYEGHLSKDESVRLVLKATDSSVTDSPTFRYVINLTLKYVKGPTIDGYLEIENDALPGEYIYANAYGVNIDIDDENMGISKRNWYIVDKTCKLTSNTEIRNYLDRVGTAASINSELISENDKRQIHIPAYRYRDGWNVVYEIVANNLSFFVTPDTTTHDPADDDEEETDPAYNCLTVHNYHRMKPMVPMTTTPEDLRLSDGAWIYIEDDEDMAYFFDWLSVLQAEGCERTCEGSMTVDPRYAEGLTVQLLRDVAMPEDADGTTLKFAGTFHGNGHIIDMGKNTAFIGENLGIFYNTGFVSSAVSSSGAAAFGKNSGTIDCCFFYNPVNADKGKMSGAATNSGSFENCYTSSKTDAEDIMYASHDDFRYGKVAYNLNRFYLEERYNRRPGGSTRAGDNPIQAKFRDGEYRYGAVRTDDHPFLLRTAAVPNYRDYLGLRINATPEQVTSGEIKGTVATMHDVTEPIDMDRAIKDADSKPILVNNKAQYEPLFDADYLFFGQDLTYGTTDVYPHAAYTTTRVYRASGFYGSKIDEGFHFNRNIQALHPGLTAIDFSGVRDAAHGNAYSTGLTVDADRKAWYAPQLDLPVLEECTFDVGTHLQEEATGSVPDSHISRNMLVYREKDTMDYLSDFRYGTDKPFEEVYCHVIDVPDAADVIGKVPNADYVQLVDKEDFNAPIAFDVNRTIWYRRMPAQWADSGNGWEGICLPFTANITYGSVESRVPGSRKNHGLMTHFYGDNESYDAAAADGNYWTRNTHEYWLRKFTGVEGDKAYFERPACSADVNSGNPADTKYGCYHYATEYFLNAFGDFRYDETGTEHIAPAYTKAGTDYINYPMLTANYPYLVSFPGERYYEFDCSGEFYSQVTGDGDPDAQIITFAWDIDKAAEDTDAEAVPMRIAVSDGTPVLFKHGSYEFIGTFKRCAATDSDVVVDTEGDASTLHRPSATEERIVLPFRAYMQAAATKSPLKISTRGIDNLGDGDRDDEESKENAVEALDIHLDGRVLVIENPFDYRLTAPLCDVAGRVLRILDINPGENHYSDLSQGIYLLQSFKFHIR